MNYGKRVCLVCGREFEAVYPAQLTCSGECRGKRRKALNLRLQVARRSRIYGDLDWLNWRLEEEMIRRRELEKELARVALQGKGADGGSSISLPDISAKQGAKSPGNARAGKTAGLPGQAAPEPEKKNGEYQHRCVVCGKNFSSKFSEHDYCSDDCLMESSRLSLDNSPWNI